MMKIDRMSELLYHMPEPGRAVKIAAPGGGVGWLRAQFGLVPIPRAAI